MDVAHPLAAVDADLIGGEARRHRLQQPEEQRALARAARRRLVVQHLEIVDPVEGGMRRHGVAAKLVAAVIDHGGDPPRSKLAVSAAPVRRIM